MSCPGTARAQSDPTCPNAVPAMIDYVKLAKATDPAKATPEQLASVEAAAMRLADKYDDCGRDIIRNRDLHPTYQDTYQYSEVREAQYRVAAARLLFQLNKYAESHAQFQAAEKLAGDVADYTNSSNSGSQISRFQESAVEIRKQARAALAALDSAAKADAAAPAAASPAPATTPAAHR